ncbi:hypothetical protein BDW75DRAFT_182083 [Aspergillus navahoensis]
MIRGQSSPAPCTVLGAGLEIKLHYGAARDGELGSYNQSTGPVYPAISYALSVWSQRMRGYTQTTDTLMILPVTLIVPNLPPREIRPIRGCSLITHQTVSPVRPSGYAVCAARIMGGFMNRNAPAYPMVSCITPRCRIGHVAAIIGSVQLLRRAEFAAVVT